MAGFNIQEFKTIIESNSGLVTSNKFLVEFPIPKGMRDRVNNAGSSTTGLMSFYCKAGALPGIGIVSSDVYRYGYGPIERKPYGTVVNDIMLQFYIDGKGRIRSWYKNWLALIVNADSRDGINTVRRGKSAYEMSYKEDYAVDVTVTAFTPEGDVAIKVVMIEAFPNFVGDVMLNWDDKNNNMVMPVSLTFRDWYEESVLKGVPTIEVIQEPGTRLDD